MTTFVVPDCHGNIALLGGLLRQEGIINESYGRSDSKITVVQLGDLINAVASSGRDDKACLQFAPLWFDIYLVGNHELPHLADYRGCFSGFWPDRELENVLRRYHASGFLQAAHAVDDILISHAGLGPYYRKKVPDGTAVEIADYLNQLWRKDVSDPIFTMVGMARGGWQKEGGILWADWGEPKPRKLRQLVGHTVGESIRHRNAATCIDLGAGKHSKQIAGAWIRDGEIEVVIYRSREE